MAPACYLSRQAVLTAPCRVSSTDQGSFCSSVVPHYLRFRSILILHLRSISLRVSVGSTLRYRRLSPHPLSYSSRFGFRPAGKILVAATCRPEVACFFWAGNHLKNISSRTKDRQCRLKQKKFLQSWEMAWQQLLEGLTAASRV